MPSRPITESSARLFMQVSNDDNSFECHIRLNEVRSAQFATKDTPDGRTLRIVRLLGEERAPLLSAILHPDEGEEVDERLPLSIGRDSGSALAMTWSWPSTRTNKSQRQTEPREFESPRCSIPHHGSHAQGLAAVRVCCTNRVVGMLYTLQ